MHTASANLVNARKSGGRRTRY